MTPPDDSETGADETPATDQTAKAWKFRAITIDGSRKALKLETVFWNALEEQAGHAGVTVSDIIQSALSKADADPNATSAVRQHVVGLLMAADRERRRMLSVEAVGHILNACPSPAFALSSERRLRLTNNPFLRFVRLSLPSEMPEKAATGLRLQIDLQMEELFATLEKNNGQPVSVGFALGLNERRVRGRMNAVLAPCIEEKMILGFIVT